MTNAETLTAFLIVASAALVMGAAIAALRLHFLKP